MRWTLPLALSVGLSLPAAVRAVEKGTVAFEPVGDQTRVPERYRLEEHHFDDDREFKRGLPGGDGAVFPLRSPSPVKSPEPENNPVWAEYCRRRGGGPFPAVIVLDITGGDQMV